MSDILTNQLLLFIGSVVFLFIVGLCIGILHVFLKKDAPIVEHINKILPQTQCGQCGYPGCKPYAKAIAKGDVINKCPPGGDETIAKLAELMNVAVEPLAKEQQEDRVAVIRESECIGCTLCIKACPVDAILGAPKKMHTVITSYCTGCDLCIDPCPVDCIDMVKLSDLPDIKNYTKISMKQLS